MLVGLPVYFGNRRFQGNYRRRSIGFQEDEVDYTKTIAPELVEKYCLAKGEIIPICYK